MILLTIFQFLALVLIILAFILILKKLNKSKEKRFILKGVLIWTFLYSLYYLIFYSVYMIVNIDIIPNFSYLLIFLIRSLFIGILSGLLIIFLFLKKIKKPIYIGATIGFLIYLLGVPGLIFINSLLLFNFLKLNPLTAGWGKILINSFIIIPLIFILIGGFIGFIFQIRKKKIIWIILILLIFFSSLFFIFNSPNVEITHGIPNKMVNPIEAPDYVHIRANVMYKPFLSFKTLEIKQSENLIYSWDISDLQSVTQGSYVTYYKKIRTDPNKLFYGNFIVGNKKLSTIVVTYTFLGKEYQESKEFTIEVVEG